MPAHPIIDSHFHLYDPATQPYGWISRLPPMLRERHDVAAYRAATARIAVERSVMVEFLVDAGTHLEEARNAQRLADEEPRIAAFVAHVPVEKGDAVEADLDALEGLPVVRGIRRILEDGRFGMALEPDFIAGVKAVGHRGLPFEIGVRHWGLTYGLELARRCPEVTFVLDHLATPDIRHGLREPWETQIRELARLPNTLAKVSGVMAGVDPFDWTADRIVPYLDHAIQCFGCDRLMFGSDWPMFTPVLDYAAWVAIVDAALAGATDAERGNLYRGTAIRHYRLDG